MACSDSIERGGFTLLEVLLAVFLFVLVMTLVYSAYRSTFRITNAAEKKTRSAAAARVALERISYDLESLYRDKNVVLLGEKKEGRSGRADRLTFLSAAHLQFGKKERPAGLTTLRYTAAADEQSGLLRWYRLDRPLLPGQKELDDEEKGFVLCDGLSSIAYSYYDRKGQEFDEWDSTGKGNSGGSGSAGSLPVMIRVTVQFAESIDADEKTRFTTAVALPQLKTASP